MRTSIWQNSSVRLVIDDSVEFNIDLTYVLPCALQESKKLHARIKTMMNLIQGTSQKDTPEEVKLKSRDSPLSVFAESLLHVARLAGPSNVGRYPKQRLPQNYY